MDAGLLIAACSLIVVGLAGLVAITRSEHRAIQSVELTFGRDVTPEAVERVVDRMAGLHFAARVVLDVRADHTGIRHLLHADEPTMETLRGVFRALAPSVRLTPIESALCPDFEPLAGHAIRLGGRPGVVRTDSLAETSASLLAALQPLDPDTILLLRWVLAPGAPVRVVSKGVDIEPEERRQLRTKNQGGVVRARGFLVVRAQQPKAAAHLLARVGSVLRSRSTAYGVPRMLPRFRWLLGRQLARPSFFLTDRYASGELVGLIAWPIAAPMLPGLTLGTSPTRMPIPALPPGPRRFGVATWPGSDRVIGQSLLGASTHTLISGPSGSGKSTMLVNLVAAEMAAGRGLFLLDGRGDTIAAALERVPANRVDDVIVLDCGAEGPQPGLNLFGHGGDPELAADVVLSVIADLFRASFGPLSERYLRSGYWQWCTTRTAPWPTCPTSGLIPATGAGLSAGSTIHWPKLPSRPSSR